MTLRPLRKLKTHLLESDAWWTLIVNLRASENLHEAVRPIFHFIGRENKLELLKHKSVRRHFEKFHARLEKARQ